MPALEKILIFAQVLKVVGPNRGLQTHSTKHYQTREAIPGVGRNKKNRRPQGAVAGYSFQGGVTELAGEGLDGHHKLLIIKRLHICKSEFTANLQ